VRIGGRTIEGLALSRLVAERRAGFSSTTSALARRRSRRRRPRHNWQVP